MLTTSSALLTVEIKTACRASHNIFRHVRGLWDQLGREITGYRHIKEVILIRFTLLLLQGCVMAYTLIVYTYVFWFFSSELKVLPSCYQSPLPL